VTVTETAFLCAIYALYASDCIYWLRPGEQGLTRASADGWNSHTIDSLSFTLAARRPLIVAPFLIRPAFVRTTLTTGEPSPRTLRKVARRLDRLHLLLTLCRCQAFLLLVYLPLLLVLHRLVAVWPLLLALLLVTHIALSAVAIRALRSANAVSWFTAASSIALNPLGATRALDILSQAFFDQEQAATPRTRRKT
jgi:hypothetical protein